MQKKAPIEKQYSSVKLNNRSCNKTMRAKSEPNLIQNERKQAVQTTFSCLSVSKKRIEFAISKLQTKNSQIDRFKFMINQQDQKHKMKSNHLNRGNNSNNSLLSMKDYKKPTVSREKSRGKNIEQREQYDGQISKPKSFKTMTDNTSIDNTSKSNMEAKSKSVLGKQMHEHPRGISINVNIQNVITPKNAQNIPVGSGEHDPTPKIQRNIGVLNQDIKKSRKVSKLRPDPDDFDFQCTEQLSYLSNGKKSTVSKTDKPTTCKSENTKQKYIERPMAMQNLCGTSVKPNNTVNIANVSTINNTNRNNNNINNNINTNININNINSKSDHNINSTNNINTTKFGSNRQKTPPTITIDPKQQIQKFQKQALQVQANADYQALIYLDSRQAAYMVRPDFIEKKQKNFTWLMRAVVVEWVMQVSYQFSLKRQTYFLSVNIFDRFLEKESNLLKSDFQLVGAASMFIASKLEEENPKSSEQFVRTANGSYSAKQIKQMQKKICKQVLNYQINPPTLYRWANLLMVQWDAYLKQNSYAQIHPLFALRDPFYFKQLDQDSYLHFRQLVQFIDCSILQVKTYEYNPKLLVCSFMYLVIGKQMEIFVESQIPTFQSRSNYMFDEQNLLNDLFQNFLQYTFGIKLGQLLPIVQYCSTFFILPQNFQEPLIPNAEQAEQNMQLEQYCSYQTFDKNMLIIVKKRFRGIYLDR